MNTFQTIIIAVFIAAAIIAILMFAGVLPGYNGGGEQNREIKISIWGTLDRNLMSDFFNHIKKDNKNLTFIYSEKKPENFEQELVSALANNEGPDIAVLPQNLILKHIKKISPISSENLSIRDFKNIFIDEADLFIDYKNRNILGIPFTIDPLVLYYNKNLFKNSLVVNPPKNWDEFLTVSNNLTIKDEDRDIKQSGSALGEYENVSNAKDILSVMFLQTGDAVINRENLEPDLGKDDKNLKNLQAALDFYAGFSNPGKVSYSWNKFLGQSHDAFLKAKLAMYFGYASDFKKIKEKNPNLDFDVSVIPQPSQSNVKTSFGRMSGIVILNKTKNKDDAMRAAKALVSPDSIKILSDIFFMPPVRRDILSRKIEDPYLSVFYESAVISRAWLDPDPLKTSIVFKNMIESVNSGERNADQALSDARGRLNNILKDYR